MTTEERFTPGEARCMPETETRILLVDDSDDDIFLVHEAFKESGVAHRLDAISDGEEALSFLREDGNRPDVVLLDINMPRFSGFDVLEWVQSDPELREIPIVMLTTSEQPEDVRRGPADDIAGVLEGGLQLVLAAPAEGVGALLGTGARIVG